MTDDPAKRAGADGEAQLIDDCRKALVQTLRQLLEYNERLEAGEDVSLPEVSKIKAANSAAVASFLKEVQKHDENVLISEGLTESAPLDLEKLRIEIGSRLNCIRESRGTDGVS